MEARGRDEVGQAWWTGGRRLTTPCCGKAAIMAGLAEAADTEASKEKVN